MQQTREAVDRPPYGGINRIRFKGYISLLHLVTTGAETPGERVKLAEMWNNCKAGPNLTY